MNVGCQAERKCNTGEREKIKDDGKKRTTFAAKGRVVVVSSQRWRKAEKLRLFIIWKRDRVLAPKPREGRNVTQLKKKEKIVREEEEEKERNRERKENGIKRRKKEEKNLQEEEEIESQGRLNWQ